MLFRSQLHKPIANETIQSPRVARQAGHRGGGKSGRKGDVMFAFGWIRAAIGWFAGKLQMKSRLTGARPEQVRHNPITGSKWAKPSLSWP
mgnify:CR=1 FL=1